MTTNTRTNSDDANFQSLVALLDADLKARDGDDHAFYTQFNTTTNIKHVIVCYLGGNPVGCGAFKEFDKNSVEIKRMFVRPENRGRGIALDILRELELWASELNYHTCVLETGKNQPEAIRMYQKAGYSLIPNYPPYEDDKNSVCMTRDITSK